MHPTDGAPARPVRLAIEVVPIALFLGLFLWDVRATLTPFVVFPVLLFLLWPQRVHALGRHLIVAVSLVFAVWLLGQHGSVLLPFALSFAVAYLLAPLVNRLERRRVPRTMAIFLVLLPFLGAIVGLFLLLVPEIERQLIDLAGRLPELGNRVAGWVLALRQRLLVSGAEVLSDAQLERLRSLDASDLVDLVSGKWASVSEHLWRAARGIGRGVGAGFGLMLTLLGYFVVAPVVTFYLLQSWTSIAAGVEALVPPARRPAVFGFLHEYDRALGRFVRGQLTEATLVAVLTSVSLALLGFPAAVLMGIVAGLGNLIPNIGLFLSIIPGLLIALVAPEVGPAMAKLIGVFAVVQFIDGSITGPRIVGGSVGLNAVWVMLAVLAFGNLLGFLGMFLAVPLAVLVKMFVVRALAAYRRSPAYTAPPG